MKKNLLSIILLASLISCTTAQTPKEELKEEEKLSYATLPQEFKDYKKGEIVNAGTTEFEKGKFFVYYEYDINHDGKFDVIELYKPTEKYPMSYGFDLNHDGVIRRDEILMDDNQDGLNGNERPISKSK